MDELERRLSSFRYQINHDIDMKLDTFRVKFTNDLKNYIDNKLEKQINEHFVKNEKNEMNTIIKNNIHELDCIKKETSQLVKVATERISLNVYKNVLSKISEDVLPALNNVIETVNYLNEDSQTLIHNDRLKNMNMISKDNKIGSKPSNLKFAFE